MRKAVYLRGLILQQKGGKAHGLVIAATGELKKLCGDIALDGLFFDDDRKESIDYIGIGELSCKLCLKDAPFASHSFTQVQVQEVTHAPI